jgi:hypothetical protein
MEPNDDQEPHRLRAAWRGIALFIAFVVSVVGVAWWVGSRHRSLHGADFFTALHLDARFPPPTHLRGSGADATHTLRWPLAAGSGSLHVRFETRRLAAGTRLVTAVRVAPGSDVVDGVEATVRVTDYDTTTVGADGAMASIGHVTLDCVERAGDGEHPHRVVLRGDATWVFDDGR